jgi:hypothetical protein
MMGGGVALLSSDVDMRSPCGRLRTNIEVVIKPQLHMRSLAIRNSSSSISNNFATDKANNNQIKKEQSQSRDENDWLKRARYSGCRNDRAKPPYSYASLIAQAILASRFKKLTLGEIYQWIMNTYPYYQSENSGWQNSIRHNLSLNRCFVKLDKSSGSHVNSSGSKGSYWGIDETLMGELNDDGLFKRRKHRTEKKKHHSILKSYCHGLRRRGPLADITNISTNIQDDRYIDKHEEESNGNGEKEASLLLELFNDQDVMLNADDDFTKSPTPQQYLPIGSGAFITRQQSVQRHSILGCPELTEENFTIPTQVPFSSEFY